MAEKTVNGRLVRTGVVVMERFEIQFDDDNGADAKRFAENPREIVEQLLKQEGIPIKEVRLLERSQSAAGGPTTQRMKETYHVVYPEAERSNTIVV